MHAGRFFLFICMKIWISYMSNFWTSIHCGMWCGGCSSISRSYSYATTPTAFITRLVLRDISVLGFPASSRYTRCWQSFLRSVFGWQLRQEVSCYFVLSPQATLWFWHCYSSTIWTYWLPFAKFCWGIIFQTFNKITRLLKSSTRGEKFRQFGHTYSCPSPIHSTVEHGVKCGRRTRCTILHIRIKNLLASLLMLEMAWRPFLHAYYGIMFWHFRRQRWCRRCWLDASVSPVTGKFGTERSSISSVFSSTSVMRGRVGRRWSVLWVARMGFGFSFHCWGFSPRWKCFETVPSKSSRRPKVAPHKWRTKQMSSPEFLIFYVV